MAFLDKPLIGSNSLTQPQLFEQRLKYKKNAFSNLFDPTPLDAVYEKPFYGKVDIYGTPIYPTEINMTQLPGGGLILAHDFVAAAFQDFKEFMDRAIGLKERMFADLFSSFLPKSAFVSMHQVYNDHFIKNVFEGFANDYMNVPKINRKIRNFHDLTREFSHYTKLVANKFPVTKSGFIVSPLCTNAISGLFIELDKLPQDDDQVKYERFLSRPSFTKYAHVASGFGFFVDKNAPWRLAINMGSPVTKGYMERFGISLEDNSIFSTYFYESEYYSYESIKVRLWNIYSTLITNPASRTYGSTYKIKNCTKALWDNVAHNSYHTIISEGLRASIPLDYETEFKKEYNDEYFLPIYLKLRWDESKIKYDQRDFKAALKRILDFYKVYGIEAAVTYLGHVVRKTNIYEKPKVSNAPPYKIKYFGESTSSGLYSYKTPVIIKKEKAPAVDSTKY